MKMSDQLHALRGFTTWEKTSDNNYKETGLVPEPVGTFWRRDTSSLSLPIIDRRFHGRPDHSPVTVPTTLSRLVFLRVMYCTYYAQYDVCCNEVYVFGKEEVEEQTVITMV